MEKEGFLRKVKAKVKGIFSRNKKTEEPAKSSAESVDGKLDKDEEEKEKNDNDKEERDEQKDKAKEESETDAKEESNGSCVKQVRSKTRSLDS